MKTNSQKQIIDYFGVADLRELPNNDKFKEISPDNALSFFIDTDENERPILWFEVDNGHEGFILADGLLHHWRSRSIHYLEGSNSLKQRHKDLRNIVRIGSKLRHELIDELIKSGYIIHELLNSVNDELKPAIAKKLRNISPDGMTRAHERELLIAKAKGL